MYAAFLVFAVFGQVAAQNVKPQIGYVYPPGGRAGTTIDVRIGGYDWTPDMQVIVHDARVKIELTGPAGEPILTPPPYWFGQKAGQIQPPLPREVPARITLPADLPAGSIRWQVANANGGSNVNEFVVSSTAEVVESEKSATLLQLPSPPVAVSGRISRITERDTYRFTAAESGLITCRLDDRLGQPFNGLISIHDDHGKLIGDAADTTGDRAEVRFIATKGTTYTATVHDVDFAGDRGFVYRLSITPGPQVVTTMPPVLKRAASTDVQFFGWGLSTGERKFESIRQAVNVPKENVKDFFDHAVKTPHGTTTTRFAISDADYKLEPASREIADRVLTGSTTIFGTLDQLDELANMPLDRYRFAAKKGESVRVTVEAGRFNSAVDPTIVIVSTDGKELGRADDLPNNSDAVLDFKTTADGEYDLLIGDVSGAELSAANVYRMTFENQPESHDFSITAPDKSDVPIGGKADLVVKLHRRGVWKDAIKFRLEGQPAGVTLATESLAPTPKGDLKLSLEGSETAGTESSLATLIATLTVGDRTLERRAGPILITTTLKTRCKVKSAVQDGGRIVNRGTTYPADVLIERLEDYNGPVLLRMAATQQRQRRGIRGGEVLVPAGVDQIQYPVFMPEWLETSLTARINVIGEVQIPDPQGKIRHVTGVMDGLIVMSLEGGLMKLTHEPQERTVPLGGTIEIPVKLSRSVKLPAEARIELVPEDDFKTLITAEPVTLAADQSVAIIKLKFSNDAQLIGPRQVTFRATALQDGKWPAASETTVPIVVVQQRTVAASSP